MTQANVEVGLLKQRWGVVIRNLLLAVVAITQFVFLLLNKGPIEFLFVTFAFPGFCWYIQHKHNMSLLQAASICLGFNRELSKIKAFLMGVFGGFITGWYLMGKNTLSFIVQRIKKERQAKDNQEDRHENEQQNCTESKFND